MNAEAKYTIFPRRVDPKVIPDLPPQPDRIALDEYEMKSVKGLSGGSGTVVGIIVFIFVVIFGVQAAGGWVVLIGIAAAGVMVVLMNAANRSEIAQKERDKALEAKKRTEQARANVESSNNAEVVRAEEEARRLTTDMMKIRDSSVSVVEELPRYLERASTYLRRAEGEFRDNAFAPFWDAIENAAHVLAVFNEKTNQASKAAAVYYGSLNGRSHTFPPFPAGAGNIPDPSPVLQDLRRVLRMGQTNFQFANIWEHRRTREVMIAGFRTLGEAVSNLGSVVENSHSALEQSISSDVARLVQEEIRSRDSLDRRMVEQNRMLDNIQLHRRPGETDRPSRY
jgi:hypothetical protein